MADRPLHNQDSPHSSPPSLTTSKEDQRQVAELQERLRQHNEQHQEQHVDSSTSCTLVPTVEIANGAHKYVLIRAYPPASNSRISSSEPQYVVTSVRRAPYHKDAAEPMVARLQAAGYQKIKITGGGRIDCNPEQKKVSIYGFSYGFGMADHAMSQRVVQADERYRDYSVTTSNEGY